MIDIVMDWADAKMSYIAKKMPSLVHTEPSSFACGFNMGYKQALLDLENHLENKGLYDRLNKHQCEQATE